MGVALGRSKVLKAEMQDRYAGDIGDFIKLGLLRSLSNGRQLGVAWYRYPDEVHNSDGRHISYLKRGGELASLDPELFAHLESVALGNRKISALMPALAGAISSDDSLALASVPAKFRREWRSKWFSKVLTDLEGCDIVFADPDNGLVDDADHRKGALKFGKQIPLAEAIQLAEGRCAVVYHHNTRRAGGHDAEVDYWISQFPMRTLAVRANAYSCRTFFILNPDAEVEDRVKQFCRMWSKLRVFQHISR